MTPEYRQHVAGLQAQWFYRYSVKQLMGGIRAERNPEPVLDENVPRATAEIIQLFPRSKPDG